MGEFLAPVLAPGDVVVLDNLAAHKVAGFEEAVRTAGASLTYLPPYSPDLNPIEQALAKLKALLRKAAARTRETLWNPIASCSAPSHQTSAETTSPTQATSPSKTEMLQCPSASASLTMSEWADARLPRADGVSLLADCLPSA